jgi:hypothetical protein
MNMIIACASCGLLLKRCACSHINHSMHQHIECARSCLVHVRSVRCTCWRARCIDRFTHSPPPLPQPPLPPPPTSLSPPPMYASVAGIVPRRSAEGACRPRARSFSQTRSDAAPEEALVVHSNHSRALVAAWAARHHKRRHCQVVPCRAISSRVKQRTRINRVTDFF